MRNYSDPLNQATTQKIDDLSSKKSSSKISSWLDKRSLQITLALSFFAIGGAMEYLKNPLGNPYDLSARHGLVIQAKSKGEKVELIYDKEKAIELLYAYNNSKQNTDKEETYFNDEFETSITTFEFQYEGENIKVYQSKGINDGVMLGTVINN